MRGRIVTISLPYRNEHRSQRLRVHSRRPAPLDLIGTGAEAPHHLRGAGAQAPDSADGLKPPIEEAGPLTPALSHKGRGSRKTPHPSDELLLQRAAFDLACDTAYRAGEARFQKSGLSACGLNASQ
jgi:hypothetical protein